VSGHTEFDQSVKVGHGCGRQSVVGGDQCIIRPEDEVPALKTPFGGSATAVMGDSVFNRQSSFESVVRSQARPAETSLCAAVL
jgi:hypothetical protein